MPYAVTLRFDPDSARTIDTWWNALAAAGIDDDCRMLGYAPHITLAIYPNDTPVQTPIEAMDHLAPLWTSLPVALSGFGVFPGLTSVLFAAPIASPSLLARQAQWLTAVPDLPIHQHYRTGHWVPHVTLTAPLRMPDRALSTLLPLWCSVEGRLDRVDLVRFRPVEILRSHPLL